MKQLAVLVVMTGVGCVGAVFEPFLGVLLYYSLAVLRPQYIWKWALPGEMRWSLVAGTMAVFSFLLHAPRVVKGGFNMLAGGMAVYGGLVVLSCLAALDPTVAEKWGVEYAKVFLIALIASVVVRKAWHVAAVAVMVLLTVGYLAWEINYLYVFQHRLDVFHGGYGGLDNNGAGLMLAMGLPFAFCFVVTGPKTWHRTVAGALGLLILHAVLMTYSRGAMLSGLVGGAWLLTRHRPRWRAGLMAVVLAGAVSVLAGQEIRDRFMSIASYEDDPSARLRMESWAAAWEIVWENPLVGQGIRNSSQYSQNYGADRAGRTIHNQYLQIAADCGVPAVGAYLVMLGLAGLSLERARRLCRVHDSLNSWIIPPADSRGCGPASQTGQRNLSRLTLTVLDQTALACQASLITYAFGGVFLSLEMFELPWIVLVLAGVLPKVVRERIKATSESSIQSEEPCLDAGPPRLGGLWNGKTVFQPGVTRGNDEPSRGAGGLVPALTLWKGAPVR